MSIRSKDSKGEKIFDALNIIIMIALCMAFLYPVLNVLAVSLSGSGPILRGEITFFPREFNVTGYENILTNRNIWRSYGNTIYVATVGAALGLAMTCIAAYPLAFGKFYGKKLYSFMIIFTMWFGGGLIPTYLVMARLNLINTHWVLIFNFLISPFNVIIMRSFFQSIPDALIESAKLDGANDIVTMIRIVLPLSKPALATIALWIIVAHWNDFIGPLMFLTDRSLLTLQVVLNDIVLQASGGLHGVEAAVQAGDGTITVPQQVQNAVIFASMIPMLALYPFLQKYFVKGVMIGSVK